MINNFALYRGATLAEQYDEAPEDSLNEFTPTEFGLRRFCYDLNCRIIIEVGAVQETIFLHPDISLALDDFPSVITKVTEGTWAVLEFPENSLALKLIPSHEGITCTLRQYGTSVWEAGAEAGREQVLHELAHFYRGVIEQAVALGYVEAPEGRQLLAELPETMGRSPSKD